MVAVVLAGAALVSIAAGVVIAFRGGPRARRRLRWIVAVATAGVAAALAPSVVADSGAAAGYLLGVPVVAAAVPLLADLAGTGRRTADVLGAVVSTGWAVLLALGIGAVFLPGAFVLVAVATAEVTCPHRADVAGRVRP